tara:strand:+ start:28012 stop:28362 length:351 start_codon:yes stop_codon:yes gene_type:complete
MKASTSSLLNAIILISMGLWGYFESESKAITALIPVIIGIILLLVNKGVKNENKALAHIAVLLTFLILLGLIKPLLGAFERENTYAIIRVLLMIISSLWAMISFIKSFISARKNKT